MSSKKSLKRKKNKKKSVKMPVATAVATPLPTAAAAPHSSSAPLATAVPLATTVPLATAAPLATASTLVENRERLLNKTKQESATVLREVLHDAAQKSRLYGKVGAAALRDPKVIAALQKILLTGGEHYAVLLEDFSILLSAFIEANTPTIERLTFLAADTIQNTLVNAAGGAVGAVPIFGDVVATAFEEFSDVNENALGALFRSIRTFPDLAEVFIKGVQNSARLIEGVQELGQDIDGVRSALDNLADKTDTNIANAIRSEHQPPAGKSKVGGRRKKTHRRKKTRRRKRRRKRRKKTRKK
jgi:hypothetical protein